MPCGLCHHTLSRQHEYKPLTAASREIRLLRPLITNSDRWIPGRSLHFSLETVVLAKQETIPPYYAISYAWGQHSWTGKIKIDGNPLTVPRGAEEASRGVVKGMRAGRLRALPIWIDAVCINQLDTTDEKSQQVSIMGDIFANADCVLIWLGPDTSNFKRSIRMCQKLRDECRSWTNEGRDLNSNKCLPAHERIELPYMKIPPPSGKQLEDFYSILRCRWFSRLWVVQEVVLAKQATLLCGKHHLAWDSFALAIQWARHRFALWTAECVTTEDVQSLTKINKIVRFRLGQEDMTMESLLTQAFKFESTNPLDKVYGLLGLVGNCPDLDPIVPDYRKFMMEVYAQATFFAIKQELSLELLCCGNLNTPTDTECEGNENSLANLWPSWVPRYDLDTSKTTIANFVPAANAHNDFEAIVSLSSSIPFTLQAHGLSLGKITKLRKAPSEILDTNMFEGHKDVFRYFSYLWDPDFVASKNLAWSEDLVTTIAASLVCGHYGSEGWNPYQDAETDPVVARRFAAFMFAIKETAPSIPDFPQLRKLLESCGTPEEDDAALFAKDVKYIAQKFVHLELEDGRFGIGSQVCREGDEVSILFGAKEPFVMRRVGEYYRLLGPGYVARVMKGEYVQSLEDAGTLEATDRIYEIR